MKGIQVCSNEGPRPSQKGDNEEIVKIHWQLKIILSRTTGSISVKLDTKQHWVKGFQVYSNEEPNPFSRGDNFKIVKIHWMLWKIWWPRTSKPISSRLGSKHLWLKGIWFCSDEGSCPSQRGYICEIVKICWQFVKIFFSRTIGPMITKLSTKHPGVKKFIFLGVQSLCPSVRPSVCLSVRPSVPKSCHRNSSETTDPIIMKLGM